MSPVNASRLARVVVYGGLAAVVTATSPLLSGILRALLYALLILIVGAGPIVVALAQLIHDGIAGAL